MTGTTIRTSAMNRPAHTSLSRAKSWRGIGKVSVLRVRFGHGLRKAQPFDGKWATEISEVLIFDKAGLSIRWLAVTSNLRLCHSWTPGKARCLGNRKQIMRRPTRRDPKFGDQPQEKPERMARMSSPWDQRPSDPVPFENRSALWWGALAFLLLLFLCPLLFENRSNECSALEAKLVALGTGGSGIGNMLQGFSNGAVASSELSEKYPGIPTPISCTYEYWGLTL